MGCAFGSAIYCDTGRARIRPLQEEVIVMYETTIQLNAINDVKDFVNKVMLFNYDIDLVSGRYAIDAKSTYQRCRHSK